MLLKHVLFCFTQKHNWSCLTSFKCLIYIFNVQIMSKLIVFLWLQGYSYSEGLATGSLISASVNFADGT